MCAGADSALEIALMSLNKMAAGGMYDHVGGGFHRYSVDEFWHVPHFEKMLYDNPQLVRTYIDAFTLTGDAHLAWVARGFWITSGGTCGTPRGVSSLLR